MILTVVLAVTGLVVLGSAAVLTLIRMARGPSTLDRVVAADVMIAVLIAALAIETVVNRHSGVLPVILVLSLVGFAGSLSIARFVADRDRAGWDTADTPGRDGPQWVAPAEQDRSSARDEERDAEDRGGR